MKQRPSVPSPEPTYQVQLLPEVREAVEQYAREHRIPVEVAIAEAARGYMGLAE